MRLRPGLPLLWRSATEVQVGTDQRWAVVLADLDPAVARAIGGLAPGSPERAVREALLAAGAPAEEADALLAHLRAAQLLVPDPAPASDRVARSASGADLRAWALLDPDGDPAGVRSRRAGARVRVEGLGRVGAALALTLASAGVGTIELADDGVVGQDDVGFGGLVAGDVGRPRCTALAAALLAVRPVELTAPAQGPVDLTVLVEGAVADPLRYAAAAEAGLVHLCVLVREASVVVGPLVVPGVSTCLRCCDLHRTAADPAWPALAAQLATDPTSRDRVPESVLALSAAALAAGQVLGHLDGRPVVTLGASLEVALPACVPTTTTWAPARRCGCGAQVVPG